MQGESSGEQQSEGKSESCLFQIHGVLGLVFNMLNSL
jgi:hypothetical protein